MSNLVALTASDWPTLLAVYVHCIAIGSACTAVLGLMARLVALAAPWSGIAALVVVILITAILALIAASGAAASFTSSSTSRHRVNVFV